MSVGFQLNNLLADGFTLLLHLKQQKPMTNCIYVFVTLAYALREMVGDIFQLLVKVIEEDFILFVCITYGCFHMQPDI